MQPQPTPTTTGYLPQQGYPQTPVYPQQQGYPQTQPMAQSVNYPAYPASPNAGGYGYVQPASSVIQVPLPVIQNIFSKPATPEERTVFLSQYDFMVLVDKSGSMKLQNRWNTLREYIGFIAQEVALYDQNGMDLCFYDDVTHWKKNVESASRVVDLFTHHHPSDGTDTAKALEEAFHKHFHRKKEKAQNQQVQRTIVLVFTDGEPNNQEHVVKQIVKACEKLDPALQFDYLNRKGKTIKKTLELGVRFFQIGNDEKAAHFLHHLDDHLGKAMKHKGLGKIDIVDTGKLEEVTDRNNVAEAFVNAIFD